MRDVGLSAAAWVLLGVLSAAPAPARAGGPAAGTPIATRAGVAPPGGAVRKLPSARDQVEHADGLRRALRGLEGAALDAARRGAVEAYRAVREFFPGDAAACAEAAFRAGEILRLAGDLPAARAELRLAQQKGSRSAWGVRAALETGHLERRAGRSEVALAAYETVLAHDAAHARQRDEASLWIGRCLQDLGRGDDAIRTWTRVADAGDDPLDRIRAFDLWALELTGRGDLEGGAGVLARCLTALEEVAEEETRLGERVRNALAGMRALDELARAVERRAREREGDAKDR